MNMSYCRFENTLRDLQDCAEHLHADLSGSASETRARRRLIELCQEIIDEIEDPDNIEVWETEDED